MNFTAVYIGTRDKQVIEEFQDIATKYTLPFTFIVDEQQHLEEGFSTINLLTKKLNGTREALFGLYRLIVFLIDKL